MKKVLFASIIALIGIGAAAQERESNWKLDGHIAAMYNYAINVPDGMSHSGVGFDFKLIELCCKVSPATQLSLGLLDVQTDTRYLQKGNLFASTDILGVGTIVPQDGAKSRFYDISFLFPIGITQEFGNGWGGSLWVSPGFGRISYSNKYSTLGATHDDTFVPDKGRTGFRLDIKAAIWHQDVGLLLRYQPVGFTPDGQEKKIQTLSLGLAIRY